VKKPNYRKSNVKVHWDAWEVGEVYYREHGTEPFVITSISNLGISRGERSYQADYLNGTKNIHDTKRYLILAEKIEEEVEMTKTKLFQVVGEETYGTQIATNSEGKIVLEIKGTNEVKAYDKKLLEEVMPYTVGIKFGSSQTYHFEVDKGSVEVGDIIIRMDSPYEGSFGQVVSIDTKSKMATKRLDAVVVKGTRIT